MLDGVHIYQVHELRPIQLRLGVTSRRGISAMTVSSSIPTLKLLMMAWMSYPQMPEPIGVLRAVEGVPTYDDQINDQVHTATKNQGEGDLDSLFTAGDTWTVE